MGPEAVNAIKMSVVNVKLKRRDADADYGRTWTAVPRWSLGILQTKVSVQSLPLRRCILPWRVLSLSLRTCTKEGISPHGTAEEYSATLFRADSSKS